MLYDEIDEIIAKRMINAMTLKDIMIYGNEDMLKKYKTNFIPIDSEHFSIFELIKNEKLNKEFLIVKEYPKLSFPKAK